MSLQPSNIDYMSFPTWDQISSTLGGAADTLGKITEAANALKPKSTAPTYQTPTGGVAPIPASSGGNMGLLAAVGVLALLLLKK
jgi:hypothetical protein